MRHYSRPLKGPCEPRGGTQWNYTHRMFYALRLRSEDDQHIPRGCGLVVIVFPDPECPKLALSGRGQLSSNASAIEATYFRNMPMISSLYTLDASAQHSHVNHNYSSNAHCLGSCIGQVLDIAIACFLLANTKNLLLVDMFQKLVGAAVRKNLNAIIRDSVTLT